MNEDFLQQKNKSEIDYISIMINNSYYVGEHIDSNVPFQYFEEYNRIILKAVIYNYEKDIAVTENSFKDYLKHLNISNSEKLTILEIFDKISFNIVNEKDFNYLRKKIIEFYINQKSVNVLDEYSKSLKENNKITALKKLAAELTDLVTDNFSAKEMVYASIGSLSEDFKKQFEEAKIDEKLGIFTGIKTIDDILDTGLYPGSITLFCGEVSGYKSTMMLNVGLNAWKYQKKRVLYVPLEMPWYLCYCKMISRETKVPFEYLIRPSKIGESDSSEIKKKKVEEVTDKINKEIESWTGSGLSGTMWMMDSLSERTKVSTIKREIEKNIDIFRPDLVIIDYIANLSPDKSRTGRNDLEIGDMISDLSHMGHYLNFAVVSGAQIGREALKRFRSSSGTNSSFHSEDIRGSHEYAAEADFVFAQMIDPQNNNSLLITPIKNRFGKKIFEDGSSKASLAIQPNIGLIESDSKFITCSPSEVAAIASNPAFVDDLSFDDDDDDDLSNNILDDNIKKEDLVIEKNSVVEKVKKNKTKKKPDSMDIFL